jgi:hypothetical protein
MNKLGGFRREEKRTMAKRENFTKSTSTAHVAPTKSERQAITDELIRARAYAIYQARGGQPGAELEDWLTAKTELEREFGKPQSASA